MSPHYNYNSSKSSPNLIVGVASLLMLCLWLFPSKGWAEGNSSNHWNSFITSYGKADYGKGGQTWQIVIPDRRFAFFANQRGVLEYSAGRWSTHTLGNGQDARSLLVDPQKRRLYAGGINIFGYFEMGDNGKMVFTQLNKGFEDLINYPGNVWGIYKVGQTLYIYADAGIIRFDEAENQANIIPTQGHADYAAVLDQGLYIATENGIYVLIGEEFIPIHSTDQIGKYRIRGLRKVGSKIYAITASNGIFECDGVSVRPFPTVIDDYIKSNEVFCWASSNDHYALGTIRGGLVVIDKDGLNPKYYTEDNGLQDNTVLSLGFDPSGNLWAGLDRGIDYIHLNSPLSKLPLTGESIGMGYAAALHDGNLYLGTNRGLYSIDWNKALNGLVQRPALLSGVSGQVWDLVEIDNTLYCCSDHGLFIIKGDKSYKVEGLPAIWTIKKVEEKKNPAGEEKLGDKENLGTDLNHLWAGGYNGLWKLHIEGKDPKVVTVEGMLTDVSDSFMSFAHLRDDQADTNTIWLCNK